MPALTPKMQKAMAIRAKHPSKSKHPEIPMKVAKEFAKRPAGGYGKRKR